MRIVIILLNCYGKFVLIWGVDEYENVFSIFGVYSRVEKDW